MAVEIPTATVRRVLPPKEWKDKQIDTLVKVGKKNYLTGIAFPKADPIEAGKSDAAELRYATETALAIEEKRRQKALAPLTIADWYPFARDIGADLIVDGVRKREVKVAKFINAFQPILIDHLTKVDKLAVETLEQRIEKSAENIRGLAAMKGVWKG